MEPAVINFGIGIDRFKLGIGITEAISILSNDHPRLNFEINFPRPEKILNQEIMISLLDWGIRLRFQPVSQSLFMIDYYDITRRPFSIKGSVFGGDPAQSVTFEMLHKYLGPTLPGQLIEEERFLCNFGGASFLFAIPPENLSEMKAHLPVTFVDGTSARLERIFLYPFDLDISSPKSYPDTLATLVTVVLKPESGAGSTVYISRSPAGKGAPSVVELGMSLQDIISMLGDPAVAGINPQTNSYRYEYPKLGLEFYFSESTHRLFQIVIRNNLAHSSDFGRFERCPFRLYYTHPEEVILSPSSDAPPMVIASPTAKASIEAATEDSQHAEAEPFVVQSNHKKKKKGGAKVGNDHAVDPVPTSSGTFDVIYGPTNVTAYVDPLSTDAKVRELMSGWFGGETLTREAAAQLPAPQGSPFADTLLYAYPEKNICFEVTGSDPGFVASISLLDLEKIQQGNNGV